MPSRSAKKTGNRLSSSNNNIKMSLLLRPIRNRFASKTNRPKPASNKTNNNEYTHHAHPGYPGMGYSFSGVPLETPADRMIRIASSTERSNTSISSRSNQCRSPANCMLCGK